MEIIQFFLEYAFLNRSKKNRNEKNQTVHIITPERLHLTNKNK